MESWQVTLLAAAVGGAVGLVGALGGTLLAQSRQDDRERDADKRRLRDAKRERQRKACARILLAAQVIERAMNEMIFGYANETDEQKAQRISNLMDPAFAGFNEAQAELLLETDAKDLIDKFHEVWKAWVSYRVEMTPVAGVHGDPQAITAARKIISDGVAALEKMSRERLAELEQPI